MILRLSTLSAQTDAMGEMQCILADLYWRLLVWRSVSLSKSHHTSDVTVQAYKGDGMRLLCCTVHCIRMGASVFNFGRILGHFYGSGSVMTSRGKAQSKRASAAAGGGS